MGKKEIRKLPTMRSTVNIVEGSINEDERSVEVVFTTGQGGVRGGFWEDPYIEELDVSLESIRADRLNKGLSVIDSHNAYEGIRSVYGITTDWRIEDGEMIGKIVFSQRAEAQEVYQDVKDKILRHFSLGYKVHEYTLTRGKEDKMDTLRATDWEPAELSIVPISFETNNGVRSDSQDQELSPVTIINNEDTIMGRKVEAKVEAETPAVVVEEIRAEAPVTPAVVADEASPEVNDANRGELSEYLTAARSAGLDSDHATDFYIGGRSIEEYRKEVIAEMAKRQANIVTEQSADLNSDNRADQRSQTRSDIESSIMHRISPSTEKLTEGGRIYTGLTMMEVARALMVQDGQNLMGLSRMEVAARAFHTTSDFPKLLENVMNKNLLKSFTEIEQTWKGLGTKTTASDFRDKNMYRAGDAPDLKRVGEHGEFERGTFSESKEKYRIDSFGRIIGFTRKSLINDDLSALSSMPRMFGASAARLQADIIWGIILGYDFEKMVSNPYIMNDDSKNLYHVDHNNLLTGGGSVLAKAALSAMRQLARNAKTIDNKRMNVELKSIILPTALETDAEELLLNTVFPVLDAETNSFKRKYDIIIEPRLDDISAVSWYMMANPLLVDTFEYASLAGEKELMTETRAGFDIDGVEFKASMDFGAGWKDFRGAYKANGS